MIDALRAPFPWFGGKRRAAGLVWPRFGPVSGYVEPFFGSGAMLLGRPSVSGHETVNDLDGLVANFWRAVKLFPGDVAAHADNPVNENDLHARHLWLVSVMGELSSALNGDPDFCDPKIAGHWVWGIASWIGPGFCSGRGPWVAIGGKMVDSRKLPHLGTDGMGVNRKLPHLGSDGRGGFIRDWMARLSSRLREVRVASGDWSRVVGPSVTRGTKSSPCAVFLDPPYAGVSDGLYSAGDSSVSRQVGEWAIEHSDDRTLRIAICGYEGEHAMPAEWECVSWNAGAGYGGQAEERSENGKKERIWFSPSCIRKQGANLDIFGEAS